MGYLIAAGLITFGVIGVSYGFFIIIKGKDFTEND